MDPLPKRDRRVLQELQRVGKGKGDIHISDLGSVTAARARDLIALCPDVELGADGVVRRSDAGRERQVERIAK
jgi:hypothetical protein